MVFCITFFQFCGAEMKNCTTFTNPDPTSLLPMDSRAFAVAALSGGAVWLARDDKGWCAIVASENIDGILATERRTLRHFSSLDTATKHLERMGVRMAAIRTGALK